MREYPYNDFINQFPCYGARIGALFGCKSLQNKG